MANLRFLVAVIWLSAVAARAQSPVAISIDSKSPGPAIAPSFGVFSFETGSLGYGNGNYNPNGYFFNTANTQLITIYRNLGVKSMRIGGDSVDGTYIPSDADIDSYYGFARAAGIQTVFSLDLLDGTPSEDASEAAYIWDNYATNTFCFAIGNEPDEYGAKAQGITNFTTYIADWQPFASAVIAATPGAFLGGPDNDSAANSWSADFVQAEETNPAVKYLHYHYKPLGNAASFTPQQMVSGELSSALDTSDYPSCYNTIAAPAVAAGFGYRFTEFNDYYVGSAGTTNIDNFFATALFALDALHWWAANGCLGLHFHTGVSGFHAAFYVDGSGNYQLIPISYGIAAFSVGGSGNVEPLTMINSAGLNLTAYGVGNGSNLYVTVINRENGSGARNAAVTISENSAQNGTVSAMYLVQSNGDVTATNGVTLGGATISGTNVWQQNWTTLGTLTNGQFALIVPASSAAIVRISEVTNVVSSTNSYASDILNLNPAGYWPMHEVEPAAPGDIETNYGALGLLGTAYYPDWAVNSGAFVHRQPGALAGDNDTSTYFSYAGADNTGFVTNSLFVPHTSPLSTLNPPFTVECWFNASNSAHADYYVWSQCGYEGLNAGNSGGGQGNVCGIQLYWGPAQMSVQFYDNSSAVSAFNVGDTFGQWAHVVVTCDSATNLTIYDDGAKVGSTYAAAGKYSPDYWTPFTVGNGRGNGRAAQGDIDEVAVYATNLSASDIEAHYQAGTNPAPATPYFQLVTNDNPIIYLRMDAPAYTAPPLAAWSALTNDAIAGVNGVYSPGTVPGIVPGPASSYPGLPALPVAQFSGVSSFADAGHAAALNPTGSNANFTVMAFVRGNPCDNRVQSIIGHGANSWELGITTNGTIVFNAGNGNSAVAGTGQASGDMATAGIYNDGNWHQVVAVNRTNVVSIYVDGNLDTNGTPSGVTPASVIPGNSGDVMIGSDPSFTNNPVGLGRNFAGQICDAAFFTNALTTAQIQALYWRAVTPVTQISPGPLSFFMTGAGQLQLNWSSGTLQSATNVSGPYVDVPGVLPPYAVFTTNQQQFYRVRE
ncbi:MAG TPA: LamG-like jellyroll fold domain-containing protein [Candidatus Sulfotelmatobacter sp.]|nr:LamG-like jellyroll fold domain-containing protein [Candidatus Sulfotelmatobacter sp.]